MIGKRRCLATKSNKRRSGEEESRGAGGRISFHLLRGALPRLFGDQGGEPVIAPCLALMAAVPRCAALRRRHSTNRRQRTCTCMGMIRLPVRRAWPLPPNTLAGVMDGKRSRIVRRILFSLSPLTVSMSRPRKREMLPRRTSQSIIHGEKWRPDHGMTDMGLESFRSLCTCVRPNSNDTLFESISVVCHFTFFRQTLTVL